MTVIPAVPKTYIMFRPQVRYGSGYLQQKAVKGGLYHLAYKFQPGIGKNTTSICRRASVDSMNGYWFLISFEELLKRDRKIAPLICARCREVIL